jgi:PAS domain S-box-containing protein
MRDRPWPGGGEVVTRKPSAPQAEAFSSTFPLSGGEVGGLIRAFDWASTSLGPLAGWPQSLKTITGILLLSPVPIALLWGEGGIMIYNDAYSVLAGGRHPQLLGSEVRKGWPEIADFNDNVMKVGLAGGTLAYRDQEFTLCRHGRPEQVWMNLDYSPVLDESGRPAGVIAIVAETTERVRAERRVQAEQARLTRLFEQAPGLMAMLSGPDHAFELANPAFLELIGHRDLIGRPIREALPEMERQGFVRLLDDAYRTGKAFVGTAMRVALQRTSGGAEEERILDFVYQPVTSADGQVGGIFVEGYEVTERVKAEDRVHKSEERFRALVSATSDVVYRMNPEWTEMRQLDGKGFISDTPAPSASWMSDYIPPEEQRRVARAIREAIRTKQVFELEHRVRRVDGSIGWTSSRAVPRLDANGQITEWFGAASDVSVRKKVEEALRASEAKQKFLLELGDSLRTLVEPDEIMDAACRGLGRQIGAHQVLYVEIEDQRGVVKHEWNAAETQGPLRQPHFDDFGRSLIADLRAGKTVSIGSVNTDPSAPVLEAHATLDQQRIAALLYVPLIKDDRLVAVLALHRGLERSWHADEVSLAEGVAERTWAAVERRRAEALLRENESRLRFLDALGKETAKSADADTILAITTRMLGQHLGVAVCAYADMDCDEDGFTVRGDWSAPGLPSIVGHYRLTAFGEPAAETLYAGRPFIFEGIRSLTASREQPTFPPAGLVALICMPLVKEGRLTALMAVCDTVPRRWAAAELALLTEVTERSWAHIERVRSEAEVRIREQRFREELEAQVAERTAALQQSEANIRSIFETSHLYQGLMSTDGTLLYVNATALAGIKAKLNDVAGLPFWETPWFTATPGLPAAVRAAVSRVALGATENISMTLNLPSGVRAFDFSLRPVKNDAGEVVAMVPEAVEKTARVKAEQALQQAQKMEAIGNLTGGVAHDFNNLLMAVIGSLELLRKRMPNTPPLIRLVDIATEAAKRGSSLTQRMLAFARRQDLKSERIDLPQLVGGMAELLQRSLGPMIAVEMRLPRQLPAVETDFNQLESAILNLAVNARDAMHGEGQLMISGREELVTDRDTRLNPGHYICLSITDTGEGMDEQTLQRASEPFFTTKGVGKGTGLGLSMVLGLAEQSGGTLVLKSRPGAGTTAEIWLPALNTPGPEPTSAASLSPSQQRKELAPLTILAVDDDALVLTNTVEMLKDLGHHVLSAQSGIDALKLLKRTSVDLVITDHAMPHMTGAQFIAEVRARGLHVPIIVATGYAELPFGAHFGLPRLSKPFTQSTLAEAVISATAKHRASAAHQSEAPQQEN